MKRLDKLKRDDVKGRDGAKRPFQKAALMLSFTGMMVGCGDRAVGDIPSGENASAPAMTLSKKCEIRGNSIDCILNPGKSAQMDGLMFTYKGRKNADDGSQYLFDVHDLDILDQGPVIHDFAVSDFLHTPKQLVRVYNRGYVITINSEVSSSPEGNSSDHAIDVSIEGVNGRVFLEFDMSVYQHAFLYLGESLAVKQLIFTPFHLKLAGIDTDTGHVVLEQSQYFDSSNLSDRHVIPIDSYNMVPESGVSSDWQMMIRADALKDDPWSRAWITVYLPQGNGGGM